jgi:sporulation protein YlmC with PRC-barrel domain
MSLTSARSGSFLRAFETNDLVNQGGCDGGEPGSGHRAPHRGSRRAEGRAEFRPCAEPDILSSNVVGLDIYNGQNDKNGKIQDVSFDTSKQVTGYILSVGGFLGMGTHYVAVDPSYVSYDAENKVWRASMNATKDQLKSAPEFKYGGQWTASRS